MVLIRQLLPDRLNDFKRFYEAEKTRKTVNRLTYVLEDALKDIVIQNGYNEKIVTPEDAIPLFEQQLNILKSVENRFTSSLYDIKELLAADLFDSELEAAKELNKKKFFRSAGVIAGIILEKHLIQIVKNHQLKISKKNPTIAVFNDVLYSEKIYEIQTMRKIQCLGDIRNKCAHKNEEEPNQDEIEELILGVEKIIKTIF